MCEKYNGHDSYWTWNVNLWIDNDEGSQAYWNDIASLACDKHASRDDAVIEVRDILQQEFEDNAPELTGTYADLLGAALSSVDWYEIAENLVDGIEYEWPKEDEEDDEEDTGDKRENDLATTTSGS